MESVGDGLKFPAPHSSDVLLFFSVAGWSTEVGEYQWYIHGSGATSEYLNLDPSYKV